MPKIVRFRETGGPEVLKLEELPHDEPGAGEVRLKVEAIGLNNAEMLFRRGHYVTEPDYPARLGIEAAGVVDAVGPGVSGVAVGDRVGTVPYLPSDKYGNWTAAPARWGVYGESAIYPARAVTPTPAHQRPVVATPCDKVHELGALELSLHDEADIGPKRPLRLARNSGRDP